MSSPSTPDGTPDPFAGIQDETVPRRPMNVDPTVRESRSSAIDPTLRESRDAGTLAGKDWTGMGTWRIEQRLGAGGEAELFVVRRDKGEIAILKAYVFEEGAGKRQAVMPDPEVLDAVRDLACPGLVRILEHGVAAEGGSLAGRYCEVMEECEGQIQARHWDDEGELLELVGQVARALEALHSRRIAHRDVKPANILIGGTTDRVYKLGDYGIATFGNRRSRSGRRDASPMYASPAQLSGLVSMMDDWWALGMIVQESLLGRHPHTGKSPADIQRSYVTQEFRPQVPRAVSDRWRPLLEGLLDYDPEKRWSHEEVLRWCEEGLEVTQPVGGGAVGPETVGWLERAWLFLDDGEFDSAEKYAERVLDREPKNGQAYWVKVLAGLGVKRESDLEGWQQSLSGNVDYQKALRFGTAELRRRLEGLEVEIQGRIRLAEEARCKAEAQRMEQLERTRQLEAQERERQRVASEARAAEEHSKAKAKAEEARKRKRQRLAVKAKAKEEAAEAKAKAEAAEIEIASKLGLRHPFVAGLRVSVGAVAVRWIPAGEFQMGSPVGEEGRGSNERQCLVTLSRGFFMAETPCTEAQWVTMGGRPTSELPEKDVLTRWLRARFAPYFRKSSDRPVTGVTWGEAGEHCRRLTAEQHAAGILSKGWAWRLPTEAEWEYAARAGTTGARYGKLDAIAWHSGNSDHRTHPVAQKSPNHWGTHDMLGNVWEWCSDWYGEYPTGSVMDPKGPGSGYERVNRGGSWNLGARYARSANRNRDNPNDCLNSLGFRPALCPVP